MKNLTPKYETTLKELAHELVTPERFGKLAVQQAVEFEQLSLGQVG